MRRHKNPDQGGVGAKSELSFALYRFTHTANVEKAHPKRLKSGGLDHKQPGEVEEYLRKA